MIAPQLSTRALQALTSVVCGEAVEGRDGSVSRYRKGWELEELLKELGWSTEHQLSASSRYLWTFEWIRERNGTEDLRRILELAVRPADYIQTEYTPEAAADYLNEFLVHEGLRLTRSGRRFVLAQLDDVDLPPSAHDVLTDAYVQELSTKCSTRLVDGDHDGAITVARTMVEEVLGTLEERIGGKRKDYKGDLAKQFKEVTKGLGMDTDRTDLDDRFRDVVRGLVHVVSGLSAIRNKMSDGHARGGKPAPHHARVVVNAAKTIATFLVESYAFQRERGTLASPTEAAR